MTSRRPTAWRVALLAGLIALVSGASGATTVRDVRVGRHADKTRVVIETDGPAGHRVEEGAREIRVRLEARAAAEVLAARGPHLRGVTVLPQGASSEVRLQLRGPSELRTLTLRGPDRLVLDLYAPGRAPAPAARRARSARAKPAPKPAASATPASPPAPRPAPPAVAAEPRPEPAPPAAGIAAVPKTPEPTETAGSAPERPRPESAGALAPATETAAALESAGDGAAAEEPSPARAPAPRTSVPPAPLPAAATPRPPGAGIPRATLLLGALALVFVGLFVFLRSRRLPSESEPAPGADLSLDDVLPREDAASAPAEDAAGDVAVPADTGIARPETPGSEPLSGAEPEPDGAAPEQSPGSEPQPSIFDEGVTVVPPPPELGARVELEPATEPELRDAAALAGEVGGAHPVVTPVDELERRLAHLETRLEELADAKERLERQVVAQTEELRVQRAAIARTQRVLRGMARSEEDSQDPSPGG